MRLCAFFLAAAVTSVSAQSFTPVRELKNLSPGAIAKLHTLETLNALPPGDWRFHAGDIPHGESPTLDDSGWTLVHAPTNRKTYSKAPKEAVWFRRTIEVPKTLNGYDLTGARIWFQFRADANGPMPEIIYFNGRRVALGDDLEPIILFEPAKPGDKILVAVKLLHTVDDKTFTGVNMRIEPLAASRPNPDEIRTQIITAADLLTALPKPRPDLLPKVEAATNAIDLAALAAANQQAFDASLNKAQSILSELHPVLSQINITLAGNSHIDAAWLWPRSETIDVVKRTFTTALQLMDEYPDYTFTQSAAQYSAWIADKYPDLNAQIKQRIKEGRWEIVGGMWVEPDLNLPGGESLVRQLLVGQRFFQHEYGVTARIGWNPDSFGYNWQLPQIYKRSGMDYFVTQKMHWNDTNTLPFRLFWWQSPDGSKVLTYFPTDYAWDNVNPTRLAADFAESAKRNPGLTRHLDLYGMGDHGGGPTRVMLDQADHWIAASQGTGNRAQGSEGSLDTGTWSLKPGTAAMPTLHYGTAQSYFTSVEKHLNPNSPTWNYASIAKGYTPPPADELNIGIPTWNDELYFEYHRGIFTTQAAHKRNMRESETQTLDAEKLASFAWLYGQPYPADELTDNWKKITFNQFHDLAAGSGIGVIYRDAQSDYTEVFHSDKGITEAAADTITAHIDTTGKGEPVFVFNSLPWERSENVILKVQLPAKADVVRLTDGKGEAIEAHRISEDAATHTYTVLARLNKVPALGYTVLHAQSIPHGDMGGALGLSVDQTKDDFRLSSDGSTAALTLTIAKKTGCITALEFGDKGHRSFVAKDACLNELQAFKDTPKQYDAWNVDKGTFDHPMPISNVDSIAVTEDGPLRKTITIKRTFQSSHITQNISLDANADFVRVTNDVDWHETHILLKAAFPLAASSPTATYEIPFGSITRPTTRNNSWESAQFEVPAQHWADLGDDHQGVSILNDSKYGYDALGNVLRLTLLRSPTWPDPEADRGPQHFTYAIYPHTGSWKDAQTVRRGYELNTPLRAEQVAPHTGSLPPTHSFASVDAPNVTLTAIKKSEDSNSLTFRMYEWAGKPTTVALHIPAGATFATESNLMEKPEGPHLPLANDTVTVDLKPYEILTVQVAYPHP